MKGTRLSTFWVVVGLLLLATSAIALAQTAAGFNLEWNSMGSGGGEASSAKYRLLGTIGQGVAGPPAASSASYVLSSGYWFVDRGGIIYLPLVQKQ